MIKPLDPAANLQGIEDRGINWTALWVCDQQNADCEKIYRVNSRSYSTEKKGMEKEPTN